MFPIQKLSNRTVYLEFNIKVNKNNFEVELCSKVFQRSTKECFAMQQMTANEYKNNMGWPSLRFVEVESKEFSRNGTEMIPFLSKAYSQIFNE